MRGVLQPAGPRRLQPSAVPCQPIIVTAGARSPGIGCRLPVHDTLRIWSIICY